jgi:hypothetical protein
MCNANPSADPNPALHSTFVDVTLCSGLASALGLLSRRKTENATDEGLECGCARGYDTDVYLDETPELYMVRTMTMLVIVHMNASLEEWKTNNDWSGSPLFMFCITALTMPIATALRCSQPSCVDIGSLLISDSGCLQVAQA